MKTINIARTMRVLACIALMFLVGRMQHATPTNIEELFAIELVLLAVVIITTRIIELEKTPAE